MLALTGQAWDRETLQGAQRAARTQPEPRSRQTAHGTHGQISVGPRPRKGCLFNHGQISVGPRPRDGVPTPEPFRLPVGPMGRSQWAPGPERAALSPRRFGSDSPCTLLTPGFKAKTHWKHSVSTSETAGAHEGGHTHTAG